MRLLWVAVGLILRNAWVRFGAAGGRGWTLGEACLLLLAEILTIPAARPEKRRPPEMPSRRIGLAFGRRRVADHAIPFQSLPAT